MSEDTNNEDYEIVDDDYEAGMTDMVVVEDSPHMEPSKADEGPDEVEVEEDDDIEIIDDTPEEDRNRTVSEPIEDISEEELKNYSAASANKIRRAHKSYHDERRAKEAAQREAQEALRIAKALAEENQKLTATTNQSQEQLVGQAKKNAESTLAAARRDYKEAYELGDPDKVLAAQEKIISSTNLLERINAWKPKPLQPAQTEVKQDNPAPQPIERDEKAEKWREKNDWFGKNTRMTAYALGAHQELIEAGVDPKSDKYYELLNKDLRETFPKAFPRSGAATELGAKPDPTVVSPANRSQAGGKIKLTKTAISIAKQLGLTPRQYADQIKEDRKRNG